MKGTITRCMAELVEEKFGKAKWETIVEKSTFDIPTRASLKVAGSDIPDANVMTLVKSACTELSLTLPQLADAFGEYWCCSYAPKLYSVYFRRFKNAKELLLGLDAMHVELTKSIPNAKPPRFESTWKDDKTLQMKYNSHRQMFVFFVGLVRGLGKHFKENLHVTDVGGNTLRVQFSY